MRKREVKKEKEKNDFREKHTELSIHLLADQNKEMQSETEPENGEQKIILISFSSAQNFK